MAISYIVNVVNQADGTIYTFGVDGAQVKLKDASLRPAWWNAFALPAAGLAITGTVHESGILEANYMNGDTVVRKFSTDDGEHWA